jgi:signal transduction histidine kinase
MNDALDIAIRREPLSLAALVAEVVDGNRLVAERKQQRITVRGPETLLVTGDPDRLRDAVDNLVSNAIKYSPVGGAIDIALERAGTDAVVRIHDSGPGLSPEDMGRLFGRFQRLSAKPTAGEGSTGLGLSIAKRIVDLHGGRLTGATAPEGGAVFTMALPDTDRSRTSRS